MPSLSLGGGDALSTTTDTLSEILYRFVHKDTEGEILDKKESAEPINISPDDEGPIGLTDQTVLEILTTKTTRGKSSYAGYEEEQTPAIGTQTVIIIHSIYLVNALREVVKYFPGLSLRTEPVTIREPYCVLIHYMTELEAYKTAHPAAHTKKYIENCNSHIDILLGFLDRTFGKDLRLERERHRRNPPVATYDYLWLLFKPGQDVYLLDKDENCCQMMVAAIESDSKSCLSILGWNVKYFLGILQPAGQTFTIDYFDGEREITSLPGFPRNFHPRHSALETQLIERGKKYWSLCTPSYREYVGMTAQYPLVNYMNEEWDSELRIRYKSEISIKNRWRDSPADGCECTSCIARVDRTADRLQIIEYRYVVGSAIQEAKPDHFFMLCDYVVSGFALDKRQWMKLYIDNISEPIIEVDPFQYLVLAKDIKDTIKSLVWNYAQSDTKVKAWNSDFIKEKGDGRVFLLHGSPGVGKTCTAECVADLIRRPLLSLTCGDMGIVASEVERNFKLFFELGESWGAVILMDEADVYLEQRTTDSLERNSLVSVFLRSLEYFRGVLFLTTNRVGSFDDAFMSRIHVALHYERLTDDYRRQIWGKNFNRLKKEGNVEVDPETIIYAVSDPELKAVEWNGREIRNAFQTAVAMAGYEAKESGKDIITLEPKHLKSIVKLSKNFKDYITSTHKNQDEAKRAIIHERRNDAFRGDS